MSFKAQQMRFPSTFRSILNREITITYMYFNVNTANTVNIGLTIRIAVMPHHISVFWSLRCSSKICFRFFSEECLFWVGNTVKYDQQKSITTIIHCLLIVFNISYGCRRKHSVQCIYCLRKTQLKAHFHQFENC